MTAAASSRRARFITFEGGEGTGKSTQARLLAQRLRTRGIDVVETREPGGTTGAEIVRRTVLSGRVRGLGPFAEALLMNAARDDHLGAVIRPALAAGKWVVCDRFADSTRAYQGALGGLDRHILDAFERAVIGETRPDLTLVFDLDPGIGLERARATSRSERRGPDRFEDADIEEHRKLREAYRAVAAADPGRCVLVDAAGSVEAVAEAVWKAVEERLQPPAVANVEEAS